MKMATHFQVSTLPYASSRPSTDGNDPDYRTDQDLHESTTRYDAWNYLEGNGRRDSNVESA